MTVFSWCCILIEWLSMSSLMIRFSSLSHTTADFRFNLSRNLSADKMRNCLKFINIDFAWLRSPLKLTLLYHRASQCNLLNHLKREVQNKMMERDKIISSRKKTRDQNLNQIQEEEEKSRVSNRLPIYDDWFVNSGCMVRPMILLSTVKVKKKKNIS